MSRTAKCRTAGDDSTAVSTGALALSSDQHLSLELRNLCTQPLEASYRRKLEAVVLLLEHCDKQQIEHRAKASLRTVQRWAKRARRFGSGVLRGRASNGKSSRLSDEQRVRLAADLKLRPVAFGYIQPHWTAALLMRHIRMNYTVAFSLRHCRRLLTTFGVTRSPAPASVTRRCKLAEGTTAAHHEPVVLLSMGDYARKRQAFARIKRLASSGMPLQPFAYTLFDLIHDAVPHDETSPGITAVSGNIARWIIRDFEYSRWFPQMQRYLLTADSGVSGFRPPSLLPQNPRTVLRHEEIVQPNYYRSEGYNEFFRWMGMHHGLVTLLRDEQGHFVGYYPIFRSEKMPPFSREDVDFLKTVAEFIAQGIRIASFVNVQSVDDKPFEPFARVPQGIVVMDRMGKVLSINSAARSLFHQFLVYEGSAMGSAFKSGLSETFSYIGRQLRAIFGYRDQTCLDVEQPIVRIYSHCSGAILRLHGFASDLSEQNGHFTVLIELGETEQLLRQRLAARYNLSRRQAELLILLRRGTNNKEIAERLGASRSAVKSSLRELRLKLDLGNRTSLREVVRLI